MIKSDLFKTLAVSTLCLSFTMASSLAQGLDNEGVSQSYYITEQGRPITVKSEIPADLTKWSKLYSPDGFFYQRELVSHFGSKYIILKGAGQVHTLDSRGDLHKGITQYMEGSIRYTGANYFITSKNIMYIVKSDGELIKRKRRSGDPKFKRLSHAGGMFILPRKGDQIGIINPFSGDIDYKPFRLLAPIEHKGDNFAISTDGKVYTVGFVKHANEVYKSSFNEVDLPEGVKSIKRTGGNFFVDQDNKIHTISDEGEVSFEGTPINGYEEQAPVAIGGNYLFYADGSMYMVDEDGMVNFIQKVTDSILVTNKE